MTNIYKSLCAIGVIGVLAGCNNWPRETGGGMAEWEVADEKPVYATSVDKSLSNRLSVVVWELERLAASGGLRAAAADMALMEKSITMIKREIAGELYVEAENKLFTAELKLSTMKALVSAYGKPNKAKGLPVSLKL